MSVPIRDQSGAKGSSRIQLWRSGVNGVPDAAMGLGDDNHRKSPVIKFDLRHEEVVIRREVEGR
jgi:hypothetical protein